MNGRFDRPRKIPVDLSDDPWVRQFRLIKTPWFIVVLNRFYHRDPYRDPHDHPWPFASWILRGRYTEVIFTDPENLDEWYERHHRLLSWHRMKTDVAHLIVVVKPCWTLMLCGPQVRKNIRFWTPEGPVDGRRYRGIPEEWHYVPRT